jgi:SAM-dependent methyltransferase
MAKHETVRGFYDDVYYGALGRSGESPAYLARWAARLRVGPGTRVLDVGCGTGEWLRAARRRGATVAGIDISPKAVDRCRRAMPQGDFRAGPAEQLPWPDACFDLVTSWGALEHFLDQPAALREMRRVAAPRARILLAVPNADFLTRRLRLYAGTEQTEIREDVRTIPAWQRLFESAGLRVRERHPDLHVLSPDWILARGHLRAPFRLAQALALRFWPLQWQYQILFLCHPR